MGLAEAKASPLAHRVAHQASMAAHDPSVRMHDVARQHGIGGHAGDDIGVTPGGHEADVLAVRLVRHGEAEFARQLAHRALGAVAQRKAQKLQLLAGGREQEIALVPVGICGPIEGAPAMAVIARANVMPRRQHMGAKIAGGVEEIREFDVLVASDAGNGRFAAHIAIGKIIHHGL